MSDLTRSQWDTLLTDASGRTFGDLVAALNDADMVSVADPDQCVDDAIATGPLEEDPDAGMFGEIHLDGEPPEPENTDDSDPEDTDSDSTNPGSEPGESDTDEDEGGGPSYRDLYLQAWENSDADQALVPHEDIAPVLREAGYGEIIDQGALPYSEWTVWTPDSREEPLYAYTPDLAGDTSAERERVAELLAEAGLGTERFIDVLDGQKASFDTGNARTPDDEEVGGNYGVKGGRAGDTERWLVDIDVDDYDEAKESNPRVEALRGETLGVASAHTTTDRPGHLYVAVDGDAAAIARDVLGREVDNPTASFGEIRVENQYVVGPGSEIVCGCDLCEDPDTADHYGRYELATERPPVVWSPEEFRAFLEADPAIEPDSGDGDDAEVEGDDNREGSSGSVSLDDADARVSLAKAVDDHVADAFREATSPDDRSAADSRLARAVAPWVGYDEDDIRDVLDDHGTSKWDNRGDSYHSSVVDYATDRTTDAYDLLPYWALVEAAVRDDLVDEDELVARSSETGAVVDDPGAAEVDTYRALPSGTYNSVLQHIEDTYDVEAGRDPITGTGGDDSDPEEYRSDPTGLAATVDPRRAWDAAGRVSPSDLADHDLAVNDDAGSFACPCCGEPVDVVRAVAIDTGLVDSCEDSLDETYPTAYDRARSLGAPLPEYYTEWDAIARFDALLDVIGEVTFWDLDTDALESEVTGTDDDVNGDAVRTLNPSWRESDSEASVLVFPSGTIWDADTKRVLDAVRFAAVDSGFIEDPTAPVEGSTFTKAYRRCRNHYDAPLPRWNPAGGDRTVTPDLPDGRDLVDTRDVDGVNVDALENARERVENLVGDAVSLGGDTDNTPTVVTSLPATGKTTAAIKSARDGPRTYLAPRKELQQQAVDKADRWGVDAYVLPVLSEENIHSDVLERAVAFVREHDQQQLRNREAILEATMGAAEGEGEVQANEIFEEDDDEDDDDDVDLDRATCPTAEGEHGAAWALAVHTAKKLGHTPQEVHMNAQGIFGESLPCTHDGTCEYGDAWSVVTSRDNCPELLVGSYVHAHVESVRTHYERDDTGDGIERSPRPLVFDEFIGEAFTTELGPEALDFATWLAQSLRADVADRRDMFDADLWSDPWVRSWLKGRLGESRESESNSDDPILAEVDRVIHALSRVGDVLDARDSAADMVSEYGGALEELSVRSTLTEFVDGTTPADKVFGALEDLTDQSIDEDLQNIFEWIVRDVHVPLRRATKAGTEPADAGVRQVEDTSLPIGGDLADLVADAFDAAEVRGDAARARIEAAVTALQGGPDGCRRLAAWADDGYAHPDAHHVLRGVITPTGDDSDVADATRVNTSNWTFDPDADEGTVVDVVSTAGDATTIVDRNDHGARLHTPPSRTSGTGEQVPVVGLDATGRDALWRVVLGTEVRTTDIFDSARERRQFLEDALDLRVIQAADRPRFYEGDPATKDTDGDVALLEAIAEEYSGIQAPRQRGEEPQRFGSPAAITTKSVRDVLESDPRLDDVVDAWDNYGNVTGKNELGDHRLAAILGCQHFGDDTIEQFAALAGEEVDTDRDVGRGPDLDYDSDVANAYLSHMTEDKTMQAILRFARGEDGGATVVARTSVLRDDLPVVGRGDVVETWSDTATNIVQKARSFGDEFTSADVRSVVDVGDRQVRRVLGELVDAGYLQRTEGGPGVAHEYDRVSDPGAGEVSIPERDDAVPDTDPPGRSSSNTYYTRNVRVFDPDPPREDDSTPVPAPTARAPPAPGTIAATGPPG